MKRKPRDSNPQTHVASTVFKTASSSGRMTSVFKLRELESNQRPPGSEPGVTANSNCPAMFVKPREQEAEQGSRYSSSPSGDRTQPALFQRLAPRLCAGECPAGVEPGTARLGGPPVWKTGAIAARPRALVISSGRRGNRTLKAVKLVPVRAGCHRQLACPSVDPKLRRQESNLRLDD